MFSAFAFMLRSPFSYLGLLLFSLLAFVAFSFAIFNVVDIHSSLSPLLSSVTPPASSPVIPAAQAKRSSSSTTYPVPLPSTPFDGVPPLSHLESTAKYPHDSQCQRPPTTRLYPPSLPPSSLPHLASPLCRLHTGPGVVR